MMEPEGYNDSSIRACRLKKSLDGLKQALKKWNERITKLKAKKFRDVEENACVYIRKKSSMIILALYVVDGLMTGTKSDIMKQMKNMAFQISKQNKIKNVKISYLGMEIEKKKTEKSP